MLDNQEEEARETSGDIVEISSKQRWMIGRVRSNFEKKVADWLAAFEMDNMTKVIVADAVVVKVRRKWSDRMKELERPAIPGYVFFHLRDGLDSTTSYKIIEKVRYCPGLSRVLTKAGGGLFSLDKVATVSQHEIDVLRLLAEQTGQEVVMEAEPEAKKEEAKIKKGRKVKFREGPLASMGLEFVVDDMRKNTPVLYVGKGIFSSAHITVSKEQLEVVVPEKKKNKKSK